MLNVTTGCDHGCSYCYAAKIARAEPPYEGLTRLKQNYLKNNRVVKGFDASDPFSPRFWPERLNQPKKLRKPSRILVGSMGDTWSDVIPEYWIKRILEMVKSLPQHDFIFLTKNPKRYKEFTPFPDNAWIGMTVDRQQRVPQIRHLIGTEAKIRFISFEPLLTNIRARLNRIDWVIIGQQTKPTKKPQPYWVTGIVSDADRLGIPVFIKPPLQTYKHRQEFPRGVKVG